MIEMLSLLEKIIAIIVTIIIFVTTFRRTDIYKSSMLGVALMGFWYVYFFVRVV